MTAIEFFKNVMSNPHSAALIENQVKSKILKFYHSQAYRFNSIKTQNDKNIIQTIENEESGQKANSATSPKHKVPEKDFRHIYIEKSENKRLAYQEIVNDYPQLKT